MLANVNSLLRTHMNIMRIYRYSKYELPNHVTHTCQSITVPAFIANNSLIFEK